MKGQRTIQGYRAIDLTIFAVMLLVFEALAVTAATRMFPQEPYTVSVAPAIVAIVLMRWGPWAAVHALLGGLVYCRCLGAAPQQYAVYCLGNLFSLGALLLIRWQGSEAIRQDTFKTLLFALCTVLLMQLGRGCVSLLFGGNADSFLLFFTSDVITLLFTLVVLWIARRLDGVFEDQKHYLLRLQKEREKEEGGFR